MFNNKTEEKKSVADMVSSTNVISKETKITGDISASGNIRIEGQLEGLVESKTKIVVGDSALIKGNITAPEAEISGKIDGEVFCSGTLYLTKTAIINHFANLEIGYATIVRAAIIKSSSKHPSLPIIINRSSSRLITNRVRYR